MKQIDTCLDRLFDGRPPLQQKWQARLSDGNLLYLFHYHHTVLIYDVKNNQSILEWWEKPADKRGLDAALAYLKKRKEGSYYVCGKNRSPSPA